MTTLIILLCLLLLIVVVIQISKLTELSSSIRGEEEVFYQKNNSTGLWLVIFGVLFLIGSVWSAIYYKDMMLGYGPLVAASEHGVKLDGVFNITLFFTGIVFIATQFVLFYFAYKYRKRKGKKAVFFSHDNTLEYLWTGIPALVMTFLVVKGLIVWNDVMKDVGLDEDVIEIEATGYQFAWDIRHPGPDGLLGERKFNLITPGTNPLGMNFEDKKTHDDIIMDQIYLPVNKKVRVRITSKDVLHNFYLPHFRVKMDAVPGLPTYFVFTPTVTTEEFRNTLKGYEAWQGLSDPEDPESPKKWEAFDYELACAELCGTGHYSMRKVLKVVSDAEYEKWLSEQTSFYVSSVRNTDVDPYKGQLLDFEISARSKEFSAAFDKLMESSNVNATESANASSDVNSASNSGSSELMLRLKNIHFKTGSSELTDDSKYEIDNVVAAMNKYPNISAEISGHTDNVGEADMNMNLSQARAAQVKEYIVQKGISADRLNAKGYGQTRPVESNETSEGRAMNRRIEFKILK